MKIFKERFNKTMKELGFNKDKDIALLFGINPAQYSVYQKEGMKILYSLAKKILEVIKKSLNERNVNSEELKLEDLFNIELIKGYRPERKVEYEFAKKGSVDLNIFMPFIDYIIKKKIDGFSIKDVYIFLMIISSGYVLIYLIIKYIW